MSNKNFSGTASAILLWLLAASPVSVVAQSPPRAIDGDSIERDGRQIRLWGIDAPELHQACDGIMVGLMARQHLQALLDKGTLNCRSMGTDKYSRTLGHCYVAGVDINRQMVIDGYAFAFVRYAHDYADDEARASGPVQTNHCERPWFYRERKSRVENFKS